jgi:hypothetical protein
MVALGKLTWYSKKSITKIIRSQAPKHMHGEGSETRWKRAKILQCLAQGIVHSHSRECHSVIPQQS